MMRAPILLVLLAASSIAMAGDDRATRLAELRADVADLSEQIDFSTEEHRAELRTLDAQKTDAQLRNRRVEIRLEELQRLTEERRASLMGEDHTGADLVPVIRDALQQLRQSIRAGLPFRTAERLAAVDALEAKLDEGVIRPQQAAHRTWQFYEDELRLTRENALDRQVIQLDGEDLLVDVARVGMMAIYFRTEAGSVGHAVDAQGTWRWQAYEDAAQTDQVEALFDALEKQIRAGWFDLPDLITEDGA